MLNKNFWVAAGERAVRTFAQTLVALFGAGAVDVLNVDWGQSLSVSAGAALLSVLTSVAASGTGNAGPAITNAESTDTMGTVYKP